jgi:hypothetical protein
MLQRQRVEIMSGTLHFINNLAGHSDAEERNAQKALIRSHAMKHYRRQQRKEEMQHRARAKRVDAPCDNFPRVSSIRTDHGQVDESLANCADCSPDERCDFHRTPARDDPNHHKTSPEPKDNDLSAAYATPEPSECSAQTPGSVMSLRDHRHASLNAHSQGSITMPLNIRSPSIWRGPFFEDLVRGFFPLQHLLSPVILEGMKQWTEVKNPTMERINDAVCLVNTGVAVRDQRMVVEGQKRQILAVQSLRAEISKPGVSIEGVSCAAISIMCCGVFGATSSGLAGCRIHIAGVTAILQANSRLPNSEPLAPPLRNQFHRLILMHHLINGTAISISDRILGIDQEAIPGSIRALLQLCSRLPNLMEATSQQFDKIFYEGPGSAPQALQTQASTIAREFDEWLQAYEEPGPRYRQSPLEFLSFLDANMLGLYWSARLLLAQSRDRLQMMQSLNYSYDVDNPQRYKNEADMYATHLLNSAMVINKYEGSALSKAFAMRASLHFAREWWTFSADKTRLQTTLRIEKRLRSNLPGIDWDTVLYWSFLPLVWFV